MTEKPILKADKETIFSVDYSELNKFIQEVYGQSYDIVQRHTYSNDSSHRFTCFDKVELDEYELQKLKEFVENGEEPSFYTILQDLVNRDFVEPGVYIVSVCW